MYKREKAKRLIRQRQAVENLSHGLTALTVDNNSSSKDTRVKKEGESCAQEQNVGLKPMGGRHTQSPAPSHLMPRDDVSSIPALDMDISS